jgi:hypothetical protein
MPLFLYPLAFVGLVSLPTLAAIYWLRSRARRQPVSSLLLWLDEREAREGGPRIHRLQTPLLFALELLTLLLLVLAAAGPLLPGAPAARPVVAVLDDSFSMRAGDPDSPRARALAALEEELGRLPGYSLRFVLAGDRPQSLGEPVSTFGEARESLAGWRCQAPAARLDAAVSLASEIGGERALILVLTDHPPPAVPEPGRLCWWSFGRPLPNLAFVNAARTAHGDGDRCLLEVANLSDEPRSTTLVVDAGDPNRPLRETPLRLAAHETHRTVLQVPDGTPALTARIGDDGLAIDNRVTLLPAVRKPVRVDNRVADARLRSPVEKALRATSGVVLTGTRPALVILDGDAPAATEADTWTVRLLAEADAEAYTGPFVLDRAHPLSEGLELRGVVWGAGKSTTLPGAPVVMAGNVPLVTDSEGATGQREIRLRLRPDLSTLQDSPNWPILVWNLVQWRASQLPGLARSNVRLGEDAVVSFLAPHESAEVVRPDGSRSPWPVRGRRLTVRAETVGVHEIRTDEGTAAFAVNAVNRDESDLTGCATGRWGEWRDDQSQRVGYRNVAWLLLLAALAVAAVHQWLVWRNRSPGSP